MSTTILAIDTATEACSAALMHGGGTLARHEIAPRRHGELILPMVEALLAEAGVALAAIDAIAFGRGPGAFTGVRIATAVAQGLAYAADRPVVPVSTLATLAWAQWRERGEERVLAGIDARMAEVYWAAYVIGPEGLCPVGEEVVSGAEHVPMPEGVWFGAGSAWARYGWILHDRCPGSLKGWTGEALPDARHVAEIASEEFRRGRGVPACAAMPVYLRNEVAKRPAS